MDESFRETLNALGKSSTALINGSGTVIFWEFRILILLFVTIAVSINIAVVIMMEVKIKNWPFPVTFSPPVSM